MIIRQLPQLPVLPKQTFAAAYARVSTGKDAMLHSLSEQVSYYSDYIQKQPGWVYCGVYVDEAVTGTKEERPEFKRLIRDCRDGKIDMIVTKSVSRFSRNTLTFLETIRELKALGVNVFFEEQNIYTLSAPGELMLTLLASIAQEESRIASDNMKWRIRVAFENGELANFRFLYGYDIIKGNVYVNPYQARIVQKIFDRFVSGESLSSIARKLNEDREPCVLGGKWQTTHILRMLSNEKYIGDALLQKRYRNNHIEKRLLTNNGELPKYYVQDTHAAIIDPLTFEKAQRRLHEISRNRSHRPRKTSPYTGLITCGKCGKHYKHVQNKTLSAWNCTTYLTKGRDACFQVRIPDTILQAITESVVDVKDPDADTLREILSGITADEHTLVYYFNDGTVETRIWENVSRRESWTDVMREKAREQSRANHHKDTGNKE